MCQNEVERCAEEVFKQIDAACARCGRDRQEVSLLAVSKKQPTEKMQAYIDFASSRGVKILFGENYVQEWMEKRAHIQGEYKTHLIGPLQRNKAKHAVEYFDLIESVHNLSIAQELNRHAEKAGKIQDVFLQVNISVDSDKSGFSVDEMKRFFEQEKNNLEALRIKGLMTITRFYDRVDDVRPDFKAMARLRNDLQQLSPHEPLALSMGMSADYDIAIEEGATIVRVGTALFGSRRSG